MFSRYSTRMEHRLPHLPGQVEPDLPGQVEPGRRGREGGDAARDETVRRDHSQLTQARWRRRVAVLRKARGRRDHRRAGGRGPPRLNWHIGGKCAACPSRHFAQAMDFDSPYVSHRESGRHKPGGDFARLADEALNSRQAKRSGGAGQPRAGRDQGDTVSAAHPHRVPYATHTTSPSSTNCLCDARFRTDHQWPCYADAPRTDSAHMRPGSSVNTRVAGSNPAGGTEHRASPGGTPPRLALRRFRRRATCVPLQALIDAVTTGHGLDLYCRVCRTASSPDAPSQQTRPQP